MDQVAELTALYAAKSITSREWMEARKPANGCAGSTGPWTPTPKHDKPPPEGTGEDGARPALAASS